MSTRSILILGFNAVNTVLMVCFGEHHWPTVTGAVAMGISNFFVAATERKLGMVQGLKAARATFPVLGERSVRTETEGKQDL